MKWLYPHLIDYQKAADRGNAAYKTDYGQNIDRKNLERLQYFISCAMIFEVPIFAPSSGHSSSGTIENSGGSICGGGCGGDWDMKVE